jgi:hypothetical protein
MGEERGEEIEEEMTFSQQVPDMATASGDVPESLTAPITAPTESEHAPSAAPTTAGPKEVSSTVQTPVDDSNDLDDSSTHPPAEAQVIEDSSIESP